MENYYKRTVKLKDKGQFINDISGSARLYRKASTSGRLFGNDRDVVSSTCWDFISRRPTSLKWRWHSNLALYSQLTNCQDIKRPVFTMDVGI